MPTLPSIIVTVPQLAKCVEAFTDADGYKTWLKEAVRDEVTRRTARQLDEAHNATKRAALLALRDELPAADAPTGEPAP